MVRDRVWIVLLILSLTGSLPAQSGSPTPKPSSGKPSLAELRERLESVEHRLAEAPPPPVTGPAGPDAVPPYTESLRRLDVSLRRWISVEETRESLEAQRGTVEAKLKDLTTLGLTEKPPYSVELLDGLQAELDVLNEKIQGAKLANTAAKTSLELESSDLKSLQADRRRMLDDSSTSADDLDRRRNLENIEVAIEAARATVNLAQAEIDSSESELALYRSSIELVRSKLEIVQGSFKFTRSTLEEQLAKLESTRQNINQRLVELKHDEEVSRDRLHALLTDDIDNSLQTAEIEARREWVTTHQKRERLLEESLEFNLIRRDLWERRFFAHSRETSSSYDEWVDSARGLLVRIQKNRDVFTTELSQIRAQLSTLVNGEGTIEDDDPELLRWNEIRIQALVARQKALEDALNMERDTEHLAKRLLAELSFQKEVAPLSERIAQAWSTLVGFWNIELYTLGDSSVTVGKFLVSITVLVAGLALTGRFTHFLSDKLFTRLPIKENVKVNLERLLKYFFILLVFLFSLHVVNIPLTIFTFLGGTLAIAVGFGAQNILNNFISGLILMVERPIRAGDLIQVDEVIGFVEEIGARSTRVRVPSGIHVVLPNSTLLENKVVNWTLHDQKLRIKVSVGVAYGSPTRKVVELVRQAAEQQEAVHKSPAPVVTFEEFGDSSLNFSVHFWITVMSPLDRDRVATEVRLMIDDLFRENGITIPFPQRDLNFKAPVPVRIVEES